MLVDDESIKFLDTLQIFLEDAGYQRFVLTSGRTREAIPTLERERPDIVLLDLMMPYVNSFEILRVHSQQRTLRASAGGGADLLRPTRQPSEGAGDGAPPTSWQTGDEMNWCCGFATPLNAKAYQDRLTYFDRLTGLPNQRMRPTTSVGDRAERAAWTMVRCCISTSTVSGGSTRPLGPAVADELRCNTWRVGWPRPCMTAVSPACSLQTDSIAELGRLSGDEFSLLVTGNPQA